LLGQGNRRGQWRGGADSLEGSPSEASLISTLLTRGPAAQASALAFIWAYSADVMVPSSSSFLAWAMSWAGELPTLVADTTFRM
jgi:hypothetical protein